MRALSIIIGILAILAGVITLLVPGAAAFIIAWVMGFLFLAGGVMSLIGYFTEKRGSGWTVFFGIVSTIAGCLMLVNGGAAIMADFVMAIICGVTMLFNGIAQLIGSAEVKRMGGSYGWIIASGILSILAGIIALINPFAGFFVITFIFCFIMIMQGINLIATGSFTVPRRMQ